MENPRDSLRADLRPTPPLGCLPFGAADVMRASASDYGGFLRHSSGGSGGCSSSSAWNQSYRDTETWGGGSPACGSQAVELLPSARFRPPRVADDVLRRFHAADALQVAGLNYGLHLHPEFPRLFSVDRAHAAPVSPVAQRPYKTPDQVDGYEGALGVLTGYGQ